MRRRFAVFASMLILMSAVALVAQSSDNSSKDRTITGAVSRIDTAQKLMVVKDSDEKVVTVYWDDTTRFEGGQPQEGSSVTVAVSEQDGKTMAKSIQIRPPKKPY